MPCRAQCNPEGQHLCGRQDFFSKGQACLRCSPLTKRYGWGVHCDANGKVALYAAGTPEYDALMRDKRLTVVKAMRQSR